MKRLHFIILGLTALLFGAACQRENPEDLVPAVRFGSVPVSLEQAASEGETRSLVSIDVEDFQVASLFAFYHNTGQIAVYPEHAGDLENSGPVAIEVTQKSFNWALPIGEPLDIYVIVNYGNALASTLAGYRSNANLAKSTLDALKFSVANFSTMSDIAANGIPMAGVVSTTLANANSPLNVAVKRLYARYNLYFDLSDLQAHGASLQAMHVVTERVNTEIPFFQEGFKQTVSSKFQQYDRATAVDLDVIQQGGNTKQLTLYVPENCQGNISGASNWKDVVGLGSRVVNCTYVDFGVKIVDADGLWKNYNFYLYLGTDFTTNFDVRRNYNTTVSIKIPYAPAVPPDGSDNDSFYWSDHNLVTFEPGQSVTLDYSTNLNPDDIVFEVYDNDTNNRVYGIINDSNKTVSSARFTASSSAVPGKTYRILGGKTGAQDNKPVAIASSTVVLEDVDFSIDIASEYSPGVIANGNGTQDLVVHVPMNEGGDVSWWWSCRLKYNGVWQTVPAGSSDVKVYIGPNAFNNWLAPGYNPGFGSWATTPCHTDWEMPDDELSVTVKVDGEIVRSFTVYIAS